MPEGPFGEPRLTSIGPFTEDTEEVTIVEFMDARTATSTEEVHEVQSEMREAVEDASYTIDSPDINLVIAQEDVIGATETVATVEVYEEFITFEQFDALREVAKDRLDTRGGQIKG